MKKLFYLKNTHIYLSIFILGLFFTSCSSTKEIQKNEPNENIDFTINSELETNLEKMGDNVEKISSNIDNSLKKEHYVNLETEFSKSYVKTNNLFGAWSMQRDLSLIPNLLLFITEEGNSELIFDEKQIKDLILKSKDEVKIEGELLKDFNNKVKIDDKDTIFILNRSIKDNCLTLQIEKNQLYIGSKPKEKYIEEIFCKIDIPIDEKNLLEYKDFNESITDVNLSLNKNTKINQPHSANVKNGELSFNDLINDNEVEYINDDELNINNNKNKIIDNIDMIDFELENFIDVVDSLIKKY